MIAITSSFSDNKLQIAFSFGYFLLIFSWFNASDMELSNSWVC